MKVLISADIEGTALTTHWEECYPQTKPASSSAATGKDAGSPQRSSSASRR